MMTVADFSDMAALYIPLIEAREFRALRSELEGQFIGISFDGTSRMGEAVNVTGRFCTDDFKVEMRLLRFMTAKLHASVWWNTREPPAESQLSSIKLSRLDGDSSPPPAQATES